MTCHIQTFEAIRLVRLMLVMVGSDMPLPDHLRRSAWQWRWPLHQCRWL
jgi:hypothetical protein